MSDYDRNWPGATGKPYRHSWADLSEDLPVDVRDQGWKGAAVRTNMSLADLEHEYIETVLRQNEGHRGKTARALGIDPKTLYNKLGPERPRKKE